MNQLGQEKDQRIEDSIIEDVRNLYRLKKKNKAVKDKIIRYIGNVLESKNGKQDYYKPIRVGDSWTSDYIEFKRNGDSNKTLSIEE